MLFNSQEAEPRCKRKRRRRGRMRRKRNALTNGRCRNIKTMILFIHLLKTSYDKGKNEWKAPSLRFHQDTICNVQLAQCAAWFQKPVSPTLKNEDDVTAIWHDKTFFPHFGPPQYQYRSIQIANQEPHGFQTALAILKSNKIAWERVSERASGPLLISRFKGVLNHCGKKERKKERNKESLYWRQGQSILRGSKMGEKCFTMPYCSDNIFILQCRWNWFLEPSCTLRKLHIANSVLMESQWCCFSFIFTLVIARLK